MKCPHTREEKTMFWLVKLPKEIIFLTLSYCDFSSMNQCAIALGMESFWEGYARQYNMKKIYKTWQGSVRMHALLEKLNMIAKQFNCKSSPDNEERNTPLDYTSINVKNPGIPTCSISLGVDYIHYRMEGYNISRKKKGSNLTLNDILIATMGFMKNFKHLKYTIARETEFILELELSL